MVVEVVILVAMMMMMTTTTMTIMTFLVWEIKKDSLTIDLIMLQYIWWRWQWRLRK